ncbi:hypothetical protein [Nocardia wallacei]|uniref:hypothetical protein n=1 Tax=Nocardia wallacei TaxID=480035 RepID=UPI002456FD4E|nr:hypothetical protein [Nocardia wallacei]
MRPHPTVGASADYTFPLAWAGDYTFRWSAADGVDLSDPPAAVVRGFAESRQLSLSIGTRLAYPGYADTIDTVDWLHYPDGGFYPVGAGEGNWSLRWNGTFLARILEIRRTADGYVAAYCLDATDVTESDDGASTFYWRRPTESTSGSITWLAMRQDTSRPHPRPLPTRRTMTEPPLRAPNYDVFDGWLVTDVWGPTPRTTDGDTLADTCRRWTRTNSHSNPLDPNSPSRTSPAVPSMPSPPSPGMATGPCLIRADRSTGTAAATHPCPVQRAERPQTCTRRGRHVRECGLPGHSCCMVCDRSAGKPGRRVESLCEPGGSMPPLLKPCTRCEDRR